MMTRSDLGKYCLLLLVGLLMWTGCRSQQDSSTGTPPTSNTGKGSSAPSALGDKGQNGLIGKWKVNIPPSGGGTGGTLTVEFKTDGTLEQTIEGNGKVGHVKATYTTQGDRLTETLVSMEADGKSVPPTQAPAQTFTYKVEGDTLSLTSISPAGTMQMTRVKE